MADRWDTWTQSEILTAQGYPGGWDASVQADEGLEATKGSGYFSERTSGAHKPGGATPKHRCDIPYGVAGAD